MPTVRLSVVDLCWFFFFSAVTGAAICAIAFRLLH